MSTMADVRSTKEYAEALKTPMTVAIDANLVDHILSNPPFHSVMGCVNLRDISDGTSAAAIRQGYIFRSGSLERLPSGVVSPLTSKLHIQTIFDLRSEQERMSKPEPNVPGVESKWAPSTWDNQTTAAALEKNDEKHQPFSFTAMYLDMMESHKASFRAVFEHVRDHPDKPFLFHCTAGKDRTGLLAALLLSVAGADMEYINREYALTRFGIEPVRDFLMKKLAGEGRAVDINDPKIQAHAEISKDVWTHVFAMTGEQYGDVAGYVKSVLEFSEADLQKIQGNLRRW